MKNTSCFNHLRRHGAMLAIATALAAVSPAMAQSGNAAKPDSDVGYSTWDLTAFFGWQWFQFGQGATVRPMDIKNGMDFGARLNEDFWKYVGIEESFGLGINKLEFLPSGFAPGQRVALGERNYETSLAAVFNMTPRGSKFRPYVVLGASGTWYQPSGPSAYKNVGAAIVPINVPRTKAEPGIVGGIGAKYSLNKRIALRADLRTNWTLQPHFGLPSYSTGPGSIYIPSHGTASALQLTVGVDFTLGYHNPPPPPVVKATPPPPPPSVSISGITGAHDVCPGENVSLHVTASGGSSTLMYQWMLNGRPAPGATSDSYNVPTADGPGPRSISVTATSGSDSKSASPVTVTVKTAAMPTVRLSVSPTTIAYGDHATLSGSATGSECTDPVRITYTASEGSLSGTNYDSAGIAFDMNNRMHAQTKTITFTATATDAKGQTARATTTLTVSLTPQAKRYDDIVFQNNNARVNNCGKRILLEQVTPDLRNDPGAKVILIGHRDNGERVALHIDDKRVLNAAAILSAGKGICPSLDLSRILIHSAGTDQASQTRPALCGSSVTERAGAAVRENDQRAQFRRVEVWVVPSGAAMPEGTSGFETAPEKPTKALNCPR